MDRPFLLIGRDSFCDLQLNDDAITQRHCFLMWIDGSIFCCNVANCSNLFSDDESHLNGRWIDQQPISIGPYRLRLTNDSRIETPAFSPLDRSTQLTTDFPHLGLQFDGVEQVDNLWPINRTLTMIGRGPQCKLRLNHRSIANVQACLMRTQNGCWLIDLANDGTTGVNEEPIRVASLDVGDVLQLGAFQVEVVTSGIQPVESKNSDKTDIAEIDRCRSAAKASSKRLASSSDQTLTDRRTMERPRSVPIEPNRDQKRPSPFNAKLPPPKKLATNLRSARSRTSGCEDSDDQIPCEQQLSATGLDAASIDAAKPLSLHSFPSVSSVGIVTPSMTDIDQNGAASTMTTIGLDVRSSVKGVAMRIQPGAIVVSKASESRKSRPTEHSSSTLTKPRSDSQIGAIGQASDGLEGDLELELDPQLGTTGCVGDKVDSSVSDEVLADFIEQQQSQLNSLRQRLSSLRRMYDNAAGTMIPVRARHILERPLMETIFTYDSMQELLARLIQARDADAE